MRRWGRRRAALATQGETPEATLARLNAAADGSRLPDVVGPDGIRVTFVVRPYAAWWQPPSLRPWRGRSGEAAGVPGQAPAWELRAQADDGHLRRVRRRTRQQALATGHELSSLVRRHGVAALDRRW